VKVTKKLKGKISSTKVDVAGHNSLMVFLYPYNSMINVQFLLLMFGNGITYFSLKMVYFYSFQITTPIPSPHNV